MTPAGALTALTGAEGSGDGIKPRGVAVDGAGNVFVADAGKCAIRKITPDRVVSPPVGGVRSMSRTSLTVPGPLPASLSDPQGVAVHPATGSIFVTVDSAVVAATW